MKSHHGWLKQAAFAIPLMFGSTGALAFPDIPFCPLGGPPGWLDRMTDDDDRYYRPRYYPPPVVAPYWRGPVNPYPYTPQYQAYPPQSNR